MPPYFEQGFVVRVPAWHGMAVVLDDYPGREEAMRFSGHDFDVIERPIAIVALDDGTNLEVQDVGGWKALVNDKNDAVLNVVRSSYEVIQNSTGWDIVDALVGEGAKYETGLTLKGGAVCIVTAYLDEPVAITGDDSLTLPYGVTRWTHDGSGSMSIRSTSIRVVCANTDEASAAQARRLGTDFTFRHTKNVMQKIEDAKLAIRGIRLHHQEYVEMAEELARIPITKAQRETFIVEFIPSPPEAMISPRVKNNIDKARKQVRDIFASATIPDAHKLTAYGLRLAGVEYLDHMRPHQNTNTLVGRQLLRTEPQKAKLHTLIAEVVKS